MIANRRSAKAGRKPIPKQKFDAIVQLLRDGAPRRRVMEATGSHRMTVDLIAWNRHSRQIYPEFNSDESTYKVRCPGCGANVVSLPCVACAALSSK